MLFFGVLPPNEDIQMVKIHLKSLGFSFVHFDDDPFDLISKVASYGKYSRNEVVTQEGVCNSFNNYSKGMEEVTSEDNYSDKNTQNGHLISEEIPETQSVLQLQSISGKSVKTELCSSAMRPSMELDSTTISSTLQKFFAPAQSTEDNFNEEEEDETDGSFYPSSPSIAQDLLSQLSSGNVPSSSTTTANTTVSSGPLLSGNLKSLDSVSLRPSCLLSLTRSRPSKHFLITRLDDSSIPFDLAASVLAVSRSTSTTNPQAFYRKVMQSTLYQLCGQKEAVYRKLMLNASKSNKEDCVQVPEKVMDRLLELLTAMTYPIDEEDEESIRTLRSCIRWHLRKMIRVMLSEVRRGRCNVPRLNNLALAMEVEQ